MFFSFSILVILVNSYAKFKVLFFTYTFLSHIDTLYFLCDTIIIVFSLHWLFIVFNISASFRVSKLLLVSSNIKISALCKNALAIPSLCLSPEEKFDPSSPALVSYPFGKVSINSCIDAFLQTSITSSLVASFLPILILFSIVSLNKNVSCVTKDYNLLSPFVGIIFIFILI